MPIETLEHATAILGLGFGISLLRRINANEARFWRRVSGRGPSSTGRLATHTESFSVIQGVAFSPITRSWQQATGEERALADDAPIGRCPGLFFPRDPAPHTSLRQASARDRQCRQSRPGPKQL